MTDHAEEHPVFDKVESWLTGWRLFVVLAGVLSTMFMAGVGFTSFVDEHFAGPDTVADVRTAVNDSLRFHSTMRAKLQADVDSLQVIIRSGQVRDTEIIRKLDYLICRDAERTIEACSIEVRGF